MKKSFLILTASLLVTFGAMAGNIPAAAGVAVVNQGTTLKLYYKGASETNVKVSILNESGHIVFSEVLKNVDGFVRPYNLAGIPAGEYTIEVSDQNTNHSEKVVIGQHPKAELANLVRVKGEEGKYLLTIPSKEAKDINVRILSDDKVIYDEVQAISSDFARIYNLKKVKGSVTFEINDQKGNRTVVNY
ncbi:MAG TPA: hypothetical protein VK658_25735 [Chryseolinea sp.]|nr:hypothetical protein [Chryseolinea sp.]